MFPKRKINRNVAKASYQDGANALGRLLAQPGQSDMRTLADALDSHFNSLGAMMSELADSVDMLFERIDNLERRLR